MNQPLENVPSVTYLTSSYAISLTEQSIIPSRETLSNQKPSEKSSNPKQDSPPQSENPQPIHYSSNASQKYR